MKMKKMKIEISPVDYEIIKRALLSSTSTWLPSCREVLLRIDRQLDNPLPRYYVVAGILNDGITRTREVAIVMAKSKEDAMLVAKEKMESFPGTLFTAKAVEEAQHDYILKDIL